MLTSPLLRCANVGSLLLASNALRNVAKMSAAALEVDPEYPGTAVGRMRASVERAKSLTADELSVEWEDARKRHLWAADVPPGQGYTGHAFNDYNHCDATCMLGDVAHNLNDGQDRVAGIAVNNRLGPGIERASLPELGVGGSWSTCTNGCNREPPKDVAHLQFRSRVAFKLVWCPPTFASFVLVDDAGGLLCSGTPRGALPALRERQANFDVVRGSKYEREAIRVGAGAAGAAGAAE